MGALVYAAITSLDGFVVDSEGSFDWAAPSEPLHAFVNELERGTGTYLYGRRMYEVMQVWQTLEDDEAVMQDYAQLWRKADKVVYSSTLQAISTPRTELKATFDAERVRALVDASERPVSIGGPTLAAHAIRAGIVDEYHQLFKPVVVGGGTHWLPSDVRLDLELVESRAFDDGTVYVRYRPTRQP